MGSTFGWVVRERISEEVTFDSRSAHDEKEHCQDLGEEHSNRHQRESRPEPGSGQMLQEQTEEQPGWKATDMNVGGGRWYGGNENGKDQIREKPLK